MKITRRFSRPGSSVYDQFEYTRRSSVLRNPDGSTVFELKDIEVPKAWSQVATDILAQKYFRKAGIPQFDTEGNPILDENGAPVLGAEKSIRQVVHRLVGCWTLWGKENRYFDTDEDAQAFYDEVAYTLLNQMTAPNSPQWFNTGLNFAYGIEGPAQGHYYVDPATGKLARSKDAYSRPTPHACFIQSVNDDLVNEGGIFDLVTREARIFKYGSGTGSNFSALRAGGEPLSGGGVSSGLMSFLKVADRAAGAVKSGGTTRRAAKMVILNADHPDIEQFIDWKMIEEQKVAALVAGSKTCNLFLNEIMAVAAEDGTDYSNPESRLHELVQKALNRGIPLNYIVRALTLVEQGQTSIDFATYTTHYEGDAYLTVSGQNSNNSIRVTSEFMKSVENDGDWNLVRRTDGKVARTIKARALWHRINYAAWSSADPGLQYHSTINEWHTCPKDGEINASNPCVTGDTLVATSEGYRRIVDLVGKTATVYGNDRELHEVYRIFPTGRKAVYELETKAGYKLRLTADHKVWTVNRGDVPACELTSGDTVMLQGAGFGEKWIDANIAEAIGLALGDGCVNKVNQVVISFCREDRELAEKISSTFNGIKPDRFGHVQEKGTTIQVGSSAFEVRNAIMPFAHLDRGSEEKAFTDEIHSLCRDSVAAVLRGLFTADGTVANYGEKSQYVSLDSCSLELLEQTQLLLLSFGIKSKIYRNRRSAGQDVSLMPDGKGGMAEYPVQQMHSLRISKASRLLFEKEIGFCEGSAKNERLRLMNETVTTYSDRLVDPVASVTLVGEEDVYDLTEPETHHFVANGIAVHNCSEYMFLDDTACNLASINLAHFYNSVTGEFDAEGYKHACRIWTIVLEISVLMAQFPSKEIAQRSYEFRTLGLGYANLGTVLMTAGIPYDSEQGRSWAGAITAIMTGESYAASAEMAGELGAFPGYKRNAKNMLRVIRNHRRAAYSAPDSEYEGLTIKPVGLDPSLCPENVLAAARECWDRALELGEKHGYRNAQTTVLAPTGCLVGNSLVATSRGLVPLNTLGNIHGETWQDVGFTVMTDEGERQATKFFINGAAPTRTIRTSAGYSITGTLQHRIKVVDGSNGEWVWKRFADIAPNDIVPMAMHTMFGEPQRVELPPLGDMHWNCEFDTVVPREMTPELAELVGYFMGDGSLHAKGLRFCVAKGDNDVIERLVTLVRSLFNLDCHVEAKQGYTEVSFNSVQLVLWWEACGFNKLRPHDEHTGKGWSPRIPNSVLYTNDPVCYQAFLRGLLEADGTVTNGVPCWSTVNENFSNQVKSLLLALGFPTTTKHDISGWGQSTLYVLRVVNQSYCASFRKEIGFVGARKNDAINTNATVQAARRDYIYLTEPVLETALESESERNALTLSVKRHGAVTRSSLQRVFDESGDVAIGEALGFYYDVVEANEDGGEQMTYDISVPDNVTYLANGFVSHNTIGLVMDCDTTGVEPDFAIVKFKKLSGGGYFKIVNQSVPKALARLGYSDAEIGEIERYIKGHGTLLGCPHINRASLRELKLSDAKIDAVEAQLDTVFDVRFAFNKWTLGEDFLNGLGFTSAQLDDPGFDLLAALGFNGEQIEEANRFICGTMTIEGAPGLKTEHLPIFDCANKCGKYGTRYIDYMGHVRMMAAAQPFITGAISKTINMPNHATVEEVDKVYMESWKLMVKAIALYRDGSKLSQPLNSTHDSSLVEEVTLSDMIGDEHDFNETVDAAAIQEVRERIIEKVYHRAERRRLPKRRHGFVREATVGGHKVFIRTGEYEDGTLGEIFIDMYKEGASFKGLLNCFAVLASKALQYGMPLEKIVDTFTFTRFEPSGPVYGHEAIKNATSIIDYVFRAIGYEYLGRQDFVHIKAVDETEGAMPGNGNGGNGSGNGNGNGRPRLSPGQDLWASRQAATDTTAPAVARAGQGEERKVATARAQGFTGDQCGNCGSMRVKQNGACHVCEDCGTTSGCS